MINIILIDEQTKVLFLYSFFDKKFTKSVQFLFCYQSNH